MQNCNFLWFSAVFEIWRNCSFHYIFCCLECQWNSAVFNWFSAVSNNWWICSFPLVFCIVHAKLQFLSDFLQSSKPGETTILIVFSAVWNANETPLFSTDFLQSSTADESAVFIWFCAISNAGKKQLFLQWFAAVLTTGEATVWYDIFCSSRPPEN